MSSPNDNFSIKDGFGNPLKVRAKDNSVAQDGSLQAIRHLASPYPVDYGIGGCYMLTSKSSTMAAGLTAASPIYAFRWTSSTLNAIVRRVRLSMWTLAAGFTAGIIEFDLYRATSWTVADTAGVTDTITLNNGKLRTAMSVTALSEIRHSSTAALTAGTRTLDAQPEDLLVITAPTTANTVVMSRTMLFDKVADNDHPLLLAQNEGFAIQATVPATGTWAFSVTPEWDEVPMNNY